MCFVLKYASNLKIRGNDLIKLWKDHTKQEALKNFHPRSISAACERANI